MGSRGGRPGLLAVALAAACLMLPGTAHGAGSQESLFQDDDLLISALPQDADRTLAELKALGVDRLRLSIIWRNYAPEKPAGADPRRWRFERFDPVDHVMRMARRMGIEVLLNVRGGAPDWALGKGAPSGRDGWRPSPHHFGEFVEMVARRYSGTYEDENQGGGALPRASAWSIWNEPNWSGHLQPQSVRIAGRRALVPVAGQLYRALHRAATAALDRTGHGGDIILIGETAPVGNEKGGELSHLKPLAFLRSLFCLDGGLRALSKARAKRLGCDFDRHGPLKATGFAHHPYSVTAAPGAGAPHPDDVTLADAGRLKTALDAAAAAGRVPRDLPLWYTEYGYQTSPPDPFRGIDLQTHARWLVEAERMTWSDPRVAAHAQFLLQDDEPRNGFAVTDQRHWATYQTGLRFLDGTPKPAMEAYRFPLQAPDRLAPGDPLELWGMVRPAANGIETRVRIQHRPGPDAAWRTLSERWVTDPRGYFTEVITAPAAGEYRFEWAQPDPAPRGSVVDEAPEPTGTSEPQPAPAADPASAPVAVAIG